MRGAVRAPFFALLFVMGCKRSPQVTVVASDPPPVADASVAPASPAPAGDLVAVSVGGPRDVWIASSAPEGSTLLHWTDRWTPTPLRVHVTAFQRFAPNDIWAVTSEGGALHFDGTAWQSPPAPSELPLRAVWGARADDVWAVGDGGTLAHFDGSAWHAARSPSKAPFRSVHGVAPDDVWAVGEDGIVARWNGRAWSMAHVVRPLASPPPARETPDFCGTSKLMAEHRAKQSASLTAVLALGPRDVWIAAGAQRMVHFDGKAWRDFEGVSGPVTALWGESTNSVWAVGPDLAHWDGVAWKVARHGDALRALGASGDEVWAVGKAGRMLVRDGAAWRRIDEAPSE